MSRYSILFFVFFSQLIITSSYTLVGRKGHTASYMDNKIYFLGGAIENYFETNDFFYLDVSKPFNLDSTLPIVDLSNDARKIHPHSSSGVSTICGPNNDTIFLICGVSKDSFFYRFINNKEWVPVISFDNVQWSSALEYFLLPDLNIPNYLAPAILLPDGRIAYIGKRIDDLWFRNIYIYDTINGTWINMSTSGIEPSSRALHTAVLTQDDLIIIYGGVDSQFLPVPDQISVLDTKVDSFTWSVPNIDPVPSSAPFRDHTATIVGNYMIIAFGEYRNTTNDIFSDQIHMIDVSEKNNYMWVKSFTPNNTYTSNTTTESTSTIEPASATKSANATKSPGEGLAAIIGGTTGGIATVIIIISVSYLLYRRKRTVIYAPQAKHAINC
ncbi:uncharacterized protein OCT59_003441 [Rhizophagus irregularis]|uniref:uncharacterized protein n=1 Tax=Rhizophagus irregularis TaxID=588596 RepID=UPI0033246337|nr:hypothetical protein OCT59_003441 [Rhizophagus irregularis]